MAINQISFKDDPYGSVNIKIDNADIPLDILEIDKAETHFELNKPLNTILYNDIIVDATLYENNDIVKHGNVIITIWNTEKTRKYYETTLTIDNGDIITAIPNNLAVGEYVLSLSYNGDKYFAENTTNFIFIVDKRTLICYYDKSSYYGDPEETVTVQGTIRDKDNKKIIPNCPLKYQFNNIIYDIVTDSNGRFSVNVTIPPTDISHCNVINAGESLSVDDPDYLGYRSSSSYQKVSYPLCVCSTRENYILKPTQVYVIAKKLPTSINANVTSYDNTNKATVVGEVRADTNSAYKYARYGYINISVLNDAHKIHTNLNASGDFSEDILFIDLIDAIENDEPTVVHDDTSASLGTQVNASVIKSSLKVGDTMQCDAQIISTYGNVIDGMIAFSLYNSDERQVYRYVSKLDEEGKATFLFNTSKSGTYTVKINYYGMGRYKDSENNEDIVFEVV